MLVKKNQYENENVRKHLDEWMIPISGSTGLESKS